ncbi:aminotransferase class V-fold PLP-dependent enzyme [Alkalibaculum sp. M08DMB]|uniref:Aminotransferase class V-fold PLP-dependent enzyme n=1 Tax=Alkalibaculum sporogenes TaxID=2655001 RepID=A0A6A7KBZ0_9FIRM|nr:PLP-dependent aspartate aminotransferase family protein [Alkalibaculum sporogenes]MPW26875.1 aminotransferase class V-fold PLP-dependent enzyme [Alkalibaculum sporogenes]
MKNKCKNIDNVKKRSIDTKVVHGNKSFDEKTGAISFPIYQSATFRHPSLTETTGYDYSRLQNPTREEVECIVANLENGKHGFAFSSGMAAVSTVLTLFNSHDHIIVSEDLYGGTYRAFEEIYRKYGITFSYIDTSSLKNTEEAIQENTAAIFVETPSNPMMRITDIRGISHLARNKNVMLIVDNTFLTPYSQRPLELGADVIIHSGTKYLGGHNDTLAGFIVANNDELADKIKLIQKTEGAVLSPFDSWLVIRGIKTLGIRLERQQSNALKIAKWLENHHNVEQVYYIGLESHPGYEINRSQSTGSGAMISFSVKDSSLVDSILKKIKLIIYAESLGGVESLITYPVMQTHAAIPVEIRDKLGVTDKLLRLSVGIENVEDLIEDLKQAME